MKYILACCVPLFLIALPNFCDGSERVFTIDKPILEVAKSISLEWAEGSLDNLPEILFNVDISLNAYARPKFHYYKFSLSLEEPINRLWRFDKSIELWGQDGQTIVKTRVDIGWGKTRGFPFRWVTRIKEALVEVGESVILNLEKQAIDKAVR